MNLQRAEDEFRERLDALERDSIDCARFAYIQAAIHHLAGGDMAIHDRVNLHAGLWNTILASLQSSAFIALGRIFDDDRGTHSAENLLKFSEKTVGIFSRPALEARKVRRGLSPQDAKHYAATAFELRPGGLATLRDEFDNRRRFFRDKVAPIRHRVFAHRERINTIERDGLFTAVLARPLEELVIFPLRLHRALLYLYEDGREPVLADAPSKIGHVMKALPERGTDTWEHLHAAKDAAAFLEWIKAAPLPED